MTVALPYKADLTPAGIRRLREDSGLNRREFADLIGVAYVTVYHWEEGHTAPYNFSRARLRELAAELYRSTEQQT